MTGHATWEELAVGHALSALEPEDEETFLAHLRGCDLCAATLGEMRDLSAQLAYAAEPEEPPAGLRGRILDGVRTSGRPAMFPQQRDVTPLPDRARRLPPLTTRFVATAASLVLVFSLAAWNLHLRSNLETQRRVADRARTIERLVADPATRQVRLTSDSGAHGTVLIHDGRASLVLEGFPRNDRSNSVYVLWEQDASGTFRAVRPFDIVNDGTNLIAELPLSVPIDSLQALAISYEPGRATPASPTKRVAAGTPTA